MIHAMISTRAIRTFAMLAAISVFFAAVQPAHAGCRQGVWLTFRNDSDKCVWATIYYSYVMQAGWKIERAHEVPPNGGEWMSLVKYNYPELGPQIGARAEVMNTIPCKAAPTVADVRVNEDVQKVKMNGNWEYGARKATITKTNGNYAIRMGLGAYPQNQCY